MVAVVIYCREGDNEASEQEFRLVLGAWESLNASQLAYALRKHNTIFVVVVGERKRVLGNDNTVTASAAAVTDNTAASIINATAATTKNATASGNLTAVTGPAVPNANAYVSERKKGKDMEVECYKSVQGKSQAPFQTPNKYDGNCDGRAAHSDRHLRQHARSKALLIKHILHHFPRRRIQARASATGGGL